MPINARAALLALDKPHRTRYGKTPGGLIVLFDELRRCV